MKYLALFLASFPFAAFATEKPIKVFIVAGDELVLEQAPINGRTDGIFEAFYPNPVKTADEKSKHVNCAVYAGAYSPTADYEIMKPVATGLVELGEQRSRQIQRAKRGREPVPFTPFPEAAMKDNHTTVLRGWVEVPYEGHYEFRAGEGEAAFNVTEVNGVKTYHRAPGQVEATITPVKLTPGTRHVFRTIFFGKPGHAFHITLLDKPGALATVVANRPEDDFLRTKDGTWATHDDVVLFDAHPIHNNTETAGHFLKVGDVAYGGRQPRGMIGIEQTLGRALGDHFEEPVMLVRFGTHQSGFARGSRSLAHDYLPPSSGGGAATEAKWDVIHFNWGVWDMAYRDPKPGDKWHSNKFTGKLTTPLDVFDKNLRELVAKMKATGATLIWGSITPMHKDIISRFAEDPPRYNAVAEKIMKENGVRINDLYAESIRQGFPKGPDVHSTGDLSAKAIEAIEAALASRPNKSKPLPRVLLIGDSITGSYQNAVMKHFEGKANVYKNPGNAEHTGTGLKHIDEWLDPKNHLNSGQEYSELVNGVKKTLADMDRYYPGYKGQPVELAGLVWFQGIADASSPRMAAEYQQHLPNLIRDLRKDLGKPKLPVVVAAIGSDVSHASKVRAAQLAAADPSNGITVVDTRPFLRPAAVSPAPSEAIYHGNAESYLLLGDALGTAMLKLQRQTQTAIKAVTTSNVSAEVKEPAMTPALTEARRSAVIASHTLSKVQRWLHEAALPKIDSKIGLYLSHDRGGVRYPKALWNYEDTAADTYPFLFWAAWYTDHGKVNGPVLGVLEAEQRLCNHLDRIPTAFDPVTLTKDIKTKDDLIFGASEYVKDGLIAIVEVAGTDNPWFERMRAIEDDIWKHADIETPYGNIPTKNLEVNGDQVQALVRLFTATGERKYLDWAERLADYYLLGGDFVPERLRDHGCEIIGGLGLLVAVQSVHHPEKERIHRPLVQKMLDEILKRGTNEHGFMHDTLDGGKLSDGWGYNYVSYLCLDMATGTDRYRAAVEKPLRNLANPRYHNINWGEPSMDGIADSTEGAMYLVNRLPVPEAIAWIDREVTTNITHSAEPAETGRLWKTYKLEANGVRTALQHAMMHTRGTIARPWRRDLSLGASQSVGELTIVMKADKPWTGSVIIDRPRHRMEMKFSKDWPRMNSMPEWFTAEPDAQYAVKDLSSGETVTCKGTELHAGLPFTLEAGVEKQLLIQRQPSFRQGP